MALATREHAAIAAAIRHRDSAGAAQRMGAHLERLIGDIEGIRHLNPDYFVVDALATKTEAGTAWEQSKLPA